MTYYNHPADEPNSPVWDNEPAFNWVEFLEQYLSSELNAEYEPVYERFYIQLDERGDKYVLIKEDTVQFWYCDKKENLIHEIYIDGEKDFALLTDSYDSMQELKAVYDRSLHDFKNTNKFK